MLLGFRHGLLRIARGLLFLAALPAARGAEFPSETNLIVNTVPARIGAGSMVPVQFIGINYTNVDWQASSAHMAVVSDPAGLLPVSRVDLAPGVTVGYIRQYCFTTLLTAPAAPGNYTLEVQMALSTGTLVGLKNTLSIQVEPAGRLLAQNLQLSPSTLAPGLSSRLDLSVRNAGTTTCPAQRLQVWASPDPGFWSTRDPARFGWQRAAVSTANPTTRSGAALAFDTWHRRTILFGGGDDRQNFDDTWEYYPPEITAHPGWQPLALAGPAARTDHAMVFDSARGKAVLFGGQGAGGFLGDTWEYTPGGGWQQVASAGPAPRSRTALVYDDRRGKVVLFGGQDAGNLYNDTWEFTPGTGWRQVATPAAPAVRANHAMAFDSRRGRILLLGGRGFGLTGDMWQYTPAAGWVALPVGALPPHEGQSMIYDPKLDRAIFFGGWDGDYRGETWQWRDAQGWRTIPTLGPTTRAQYGAAYDAARGKLLIFGGWDSYFLGDTWELLLGGNDTLLADLPLSALGAGAGADLALNLDAAALGIPSRLPPGRYWVGLITDALGEAPSDARAADAFLFPQFLTVLNRNGAAAWGKYE